MPFSNRLNLIKFCNHKIYWVTFLQYINLISVPLEKWCIFERAFYFQTNNPIVHDRDVRRISFEPDRHEDVKNEKTFHMGDQWPNYQRKCLLMAKFYYIFFLFISKGFTFNNLYENVQKNSCERKFIHSDNSSNFY